MAAGVVDGAVIVDTGIKNDKSKIGAKEFVNMVEGMNRAVNQAGRQMATSANGYIQAMARAQKAARGMTGDQAAVAKEILKTEAALKRLEERQELARRKWDATREDAIAAASEEFKANNAGMEFLPWENEQQAAEQFAEDMQAVINGVIEKFGAFEDTTAFRNTSTEIEYLTEKLEQLKAQLAAVQQQEQQTGAGAAEQSGQVAGNIQETEEAAQRAHPVLAALKNAASEGVSGFIRLTGAAARAGASIAKIAGKGALSFLRKLAEGARNAAIQLAKLSGRAITSGFKTLGQGILAAGKWMTGLGRGAGSATDGFKRGLWTILKYGLGIRSLYFLFRKLRTAITESFTELAKHDSRTNASINSLKTALAGLKGSLATAFAPIFNVVAPALTYLINMLTAAINAIGAFMAALTGQSTYQKAVANLGAAGDAASGAGSAASDAADEYKELERQLAGFDDLDILKDKGKDTSGSGSGGGGGGGAGGGFTYETEQIGSGVTDFVGKLKELWENADYEGIGRIIAEGINGAFEKAKDLISWDNLGAKITEVVNGITGIINGLVDGVNWTLIGETFGEGVNTLVRTMNLLLTGIDWENLGKGFAEGLNGLVDTVSWSELGELFSGKLNALIKTIKGVVSNFKWENAGTAFATTVNSLLSTVNWSDLAATATTSINGIISALRVAVNSFDWSYAATAFANTMNSLISGVDWDALAQTATTSINKIIAALRIAINTFDWSYAATSFANTVNGLISGINWDELAKTAGDSINKIVSALRVAVNGFDWSYAATAFANTLNGLITSVDWDEIAKLASDSINKVFSALRVAVNGFDWSYAATSFANTLDNLFKGVDWDALAKTAGDSLNKVIAALRTALNGFDWSYAGTSFANTVNTFFEKFDWDNLGKLAADGIAKPLAALRTAVAGFDWKYAASSFAAAVNGFFSNEQLWADAGTIVSDAIKGLFTWGADFLNNLDVDQIANDIKIAVSKIDWPGIADAMWKFLKAAIAGLGKGLSDLLSPIQEEADDYEIVIGATGEVYFVPKPGKGLHTEGDHWELDEEVDADANVNPNLPEDVDKLIEGQLEGVDAEVPVAPTIPYNSGKVIEDEWAGQGVRLDTDIKPNVPQQSGQVATSAWGKLGTKLPTDVAPNVPANTVSQAQGAWNKLNPKLEASVEGKLLPKAADGSSTLGGVFGTVLDAAAKLSSTAASGSSTLIGVFGSSFDTHSNLKGKVSGSKGLSEVYPDFDTRSNLKGKVKDSSSLEDVYGDVDTRSNLKGRVKDSNKLTDVYPDFNTQSNLTGRVKGSNKLTDVYGEKFGTKSDLTGKAKGSKTLTDVFGKTFTVTATLSSTISGLKDFVNKVADTLKDALQKIWNSFSNKANGGIITNGGKEMSFASGGVIRGGAARYLASVPHYAGGTTRAHGTVFVAGEAGPEIMGHINGRTEILNKSQLAQTMYSAVASAMGQAVSALGTFLSGQLADCTNAITGTIGNVAAIRGLEYHAPVMASGSVLPYEVAAQVARTGADIRNTLDSNNEDLIQTIISVAGQIVAAVQMSGQNQQPSGAGGGLTAQQLINDINRRAQMFGASPLLE